MNAPVELDSWCTPGNPFQQYPPNCVSLAVATEDIIGVQDGKKVLIVVV